MDINYRRPNPPNLANLYAALQAHGCATFSRCLAEAGLAELLREGGPFTVFAPTDEAFRAMQQEAHDTLMEDAPRLRAVLEYHVVTGACNLNSVRRGQFRTLQGDTLTIGITDDGITANHANARGKPVSCANGTIQSIDAVLVPGYVPAPSLQALAESPWSGKRPPGARGG